MSLAAQRIGTDMMVDQLSLKQDSILAVIPCLNEEDHIEACVRSLMTGDETLRKVPLVIVDGGSTDRTLSIVESLMEEFDNLTVLNNPKKIQSAAINLAAQQSVTERSEWLVRCDAHSIYPSNFILDVVDRLIETGAQSVVVPMDAVGRTCFEKANAWIVDTPLGSGGSAHRGGRQSGYVDHGHHAGFALSDFVQLGGYDETFSHNEDAEYDARLTQDGGKIYLDAETRIQYVPRGTVRGLAKQYFNYGKGRARNAHKNKTRLKIRQLLPVVALLASLIGAALAPLFLPALLIPLSYVSILTMTSAYVMLKRRSTCGVFSGLAIGTMHMSWACGFIKQSLDQFFEEKPVSGAASIKMRIVSFRNTIVNLGRAVLGLVSFRPMQSSNRSGNKGSQSARRTETRMTRVTRAPEGQCIYAIGDIHGRYELLDALIGLIDEDAKTLPEETRCTLVFLGDYIDRGLQSNQVIELLSGGRLSDYDCVFLLGNHEDALLKFWHDPSFGDKWARYGGNETLLSYGLLPPATAIGSRATPEAWERVWQDFRRVFPKHHLKFFSDLNHYYEAGDYVFVHAGLRPGLALEDQSAEDLIWIRDEFLDDTQPFDRLIVHGHTPTNEVYMDNRRLGLDTGAYMTGVLTAARLFGEDISILKTTR
ncbi:MAG: glycosyltransferase [Pseudomonadota bacterium]